MVTLGVFRPLLSPVLLRREKPGPGQSTGLIARLNAREVLLAAHRSTQREVGSVPRVPQSLQARVLCVKSANTRDIIKKSTRPRVPH